MYIIIKSDDEEYRMSTYPTIAPNRYYISNYGNIKSVSGYKFTIKRTKHNARYARAHLRLANGGNGDISVHRLVAWEFCSGYDEKLGKTMVNHLDGDGYNNYYENLEWCTQSDNEKHKYEHLGYIPIKPPTYYGEKHPTSTTSEKLVRTICEYLQSGETISQIMYRFGYSGQNDNKILYSLIYDILNGRRWKTVSCEYNFDRDERSTTIPRVIH